MYQVKLPVFEGPFDLLLYLIKKNEINIYDIPIAKITKEYLEYIELMENMNLEVGYEFIVIAANLIYIKSKMLLPKENEEEDPRLELVQKLIEYEKIKNVAKELSILEEKRKEIFARNIEDELVEEEYIEATLYDLLKAFEKVIAYLPKEEEYREIEKEKFNVEEKMKEILENVKMNGKVSFYSFFLGRCKREIIVIFLAILELVYRKLIKVMQKRNFDDILIING